MSNVRGGVHDSIPRATRKVEGKASRGPLRSSQAQVGDEVVWDASLFNPRPTL